MANAPKMTWREKAAARAAAAAAAATNLATGAAVGIAAAVKKGVKFIGDATGGTNVAKSPTRKASPHRNRAATRRVLKPAKRVTPNAAAPQSPSKPAPKFARMLVEHGIKASPKKRRHTRRPARKEKRGKKRFTRHHR